MGYWWGLRRVFDSANCRVLPVRGTRAGRLAPGGRGSGSVPNVPGMRPE